MPSLRDSLIFRTAQSETQIADERRLSMVGGFESESFNSWSEMERHLVAKYVLEEATVCLLQDFVRSESTMNFGRLSACEIEKGAILIEVSVGYRMRLAVHLVSSSGDSSRLPGKSEYRSIARCATTVFSRYVSDRVVGLMTERSENNVAWLYLDEEGAVESASGATAEFCRSCFSGSALVDGYFPASIADYLNEMIKGLVQERKLAEGKALAFALKAEGGVVHCLLRVVASDGFLLSMCRDG